MYHLIEILFNLGVGGSVVLGAACVVERVVGKRLDKPLARAHRAGRERRSPHYLRG